MDSQTLKTFMVVAESQSFSKAASKLFLTQSAISKRIALLEEQLDCRLFDRIGRQVSMTEAGMALLPRAREILLQLEDTQRLISNLSSDSVTGRLSLAASHHISLHRFPPILKKFTNTYPNVELDLGFTESEVAYDKVLKGELELALITLSPNPDANIHSKIIWNDPLEYVVSINHSLSTPAQIQLEDLTKFNAILPDSNTFTRSLIENMFQQHKLELSVTMSTNYLDTIRMMVSIGLGWSILPRSLIDDNFRILNVVNSESINRQLGIIFHRNRTLSRAANCLVQLLQSGANLSS